MRYLIIIGIFLIGACVTPPNQVEPISVPMDYVGHAARVPIKLNGNDTHFIFDTGIGVTVLLKPVAERMNLKSSGQFTGKRMSGQTVSLGLTHIESLEVAGHKLENPSVGILALDLPPSFKDTEGFFGLRQFENTPVTLDYRNNRLIAETPKSLTDRLAKGTVVPVELDIDGPSLSIFARLVLPNGKVIRVEIDTGSDDLILNEKFMADFGVKPESSGITTRTGKDETGHSYARYFGKVKGEVHFESANNTEQIDPKVMFQKIIYDGLIGYDYFKNSVVTFDLPNKRLIIAH